MTTEELQDLEKIAYSQQPWFAAKQLKEYLKTVNTEKEPEKRTIKQSNSLHLWFRQCADVCQAAGVDAKIVFAATMHVDMNEFAMKSLWHALQAALFDLESTTQLSKHSQIDRLVDHMRRFFAEKIYVNGEHVVIDLPPFPHEDKNTKLQAMENMKKEDYPQFNGEPTF